jgi:hypothetical protein
LPSTCFGIDLVNGHQGDIFQGRFEIAIVPDNECMIPTLMVSAACTPKLIPIATTEADSAKAFNKVTTVHIFTLKRKLC